MKALIACPHCENEGRRYILGELAPTGHILIQRVHGKNGQYRNFTIVGGNDFYLICDYCGEIIYFKKINKLDPNGLERRENATVFNNRSLGLSWSGTVQRIDQTGTLGTNII